MRASRASPDRLGCLAVAVGLVTLAIAAALLHLMFREPEGSSAYDRLTRIIAAQSARASSWDRTGGNLDCVEVPPGETALLADIQGSGQITHIYFTILYPDPLDYRDAVLRMFWDDESTPSVEVPFGDFFGVGHATPREFQSAMMTVTYGRGPHGINCGYNCYFPMPFAKRARVELVNQSPRTFGGGLGRVWYHIDYEIHDAPPPDDVGRFHAQWRREARTRRAEATRTERGAFPFANATGSENFVVLQAEGAGHLAGLFLQVDNLTNGWFGEGDDMIFIDGDDWPPALHGTGLEELFGAGGLPDRTGPGLYAGFVLVENKGGTLYLGKNAMYRWFVRDPVRFRQRVRVAIEHGHANQNENDFTSTVYWYQTEPHAPFPPLPPIAERRPRFPASYYSAHAKAATLNALLLPYRSDFFVRGKPLPTWMQPLDHAINEAYQNFFAGKYERAESQYERVLATLRTLLEAEK